MLGCTGGHQGRAPGAGLGARPVWFLGRSLHAGEGVGRAEGPEEAGQHGVATAGWAGGRLPLLQGGHFPLLQPVAQVQGAAEADDGRQPRGPRQVGAGAPIWGYWVA